MKGQEIEAKQSMTDRHDINVNTNATINVNITAPWHRERVPSALFTTTRSAASMIPFFEACTGRGSRGREHGEGRKWKGEEGEHGEGEGGRDEDNERGEMMTKKIEK